jgi:myo-inositol catabolism protein IolS
LLDCFFHRKQFYNKGDATVSTPHTPHLTITRILDTADVYGLGESEKRLGKLLKGRRESAVISSKYGVRQDSSKKTFYDNSTRWGEQALEASLKRLDTDYIDLYFLHYWDGVTPLEEICSWLELKRDQGKIRNWGVSNLSHDKLVECKAYPGMSAFTYEYSMVQREHEATILNNCEENKWTFFAWGSLGQGMLSGKFDSQTCFDESDRRSRLVYKNFHGELFNQNLKFIGQAKECLQNYPGKTLAQLALRWILDHTPMSVVLTGLKTTEQAKENVGSLDWKLRKQDMDFLDNAYNSCLGR